MGSPRDYQLTFGGAGSQEVRAQGRFVRVLSAPSGAVWIALDGGSELERRDGQGINYGGSFRRLAVRSAVAQTVLLCVSDDRQDDDRESASISVTANIAAGVNLVSTADVAIGAGASAVVVAANAARLSVTVKNLNANTASIRVGESGSVGAARGHEIGPGESITLSTTSAVSAFNTGAGAQSVSVLEVRSV